jgi:hypothetical protein
MSPRYPSTWWTTRPGDLTIRACGAGLLVICWFTAALLAALVRTRAQPVAPSLGLAALAFLSGSGGAAALATGRGLLERIAVSARWRTIRNAPPRAAPDTHQ